MLTASSQLERIMPTALQGRVVRTDGSIVEVAGFPAPLGARVTIHRQASEPLPAEVIGFRDDRTIIYPLANVTGVRRGNPVRLCRTVDWLRVGPELLGRVVNSLGECIDGRPQPVLPNRITTQRPPQPPVDRPRICEPLATGIRSIDGMLTCGRGQRMGVFSGSGVGKSVTLGMMARYTAAEVSVVALIGERGREVNEFIERDLGPEGLAKSVVVVATSDEPAILRLRAAWTATAIAEYFRDGGRDVLLLMDSLTRFAMAQREIGLAAGEPPTTRGYPPSVFALLPRLVERAGRTPRGSITAFYSVLVEADDPQEPISDAVRGLLDGHTWLSRRMAMRGHYPAVDILESISRLMPDLVGADQQSAARAVRELLAAYREHEDLISIGAYRRGSNPQVDAAMDLRTEIDRFLQQAMDEGASFAETRAHLIELAAKASRRPVAGAQSPPAGAAAQVG